MYPAQVCYTTLVWSALKIPVAGANNDWSKLRPNLITQDDLDTFEFDKVLPYWDKINTAM